MIADIVSARAKLARFNAILPDWWTVPVPHSPIVIPTGWLSQANPGAGHSMGHASPQRMVNLSANLPGKTKVLAVAAGSCGLRRVGAAQLARPGTNPGAIVADENRAGTLAPMRQTSVRPIAMNFSRRKRTMVAGSRP